MQPYPEKKLYLLDNIEFLRLFCSADSDQEALAWEFYSRYHEHICLCVNRRLRRLRFTQPTPSTDDIANEVYFMMFKNRAQVLQSLRLEHEKSIFSWLSVVAGRETTAQIRRERSSTQQNRTRSLQSPVHCSSHSTLRLLDIIPAVNIESRLVEEARKELCQIIHEYAVRMRMSRRVYKILYARWLRELPVRAIASEMDDTLSPQRIYAIIRKAELELKSSILCRLTT